MKTKQEQSIIEEMARCMGEKNFLCADDCENCIQIPCKCKLVKQSKLIYKAGYRKQSDVVDEFKNRILIEANLKLVNLDGEHKAIVDLADVLKIAAEMRQEVEN